MEGNDAIAGLREQIIANAVRLYRYEMREFISSQRQPGSFIAPREAFDIVVVSSDNERSGFVAKLMHHGDIYQRKLLAGDESETVAEALEKLLVLTAAKLKEKIHQDSQGCFPSRSTLEASAEEVR